VEGGRAHGLKIAAVGSASSRGQRISASAWIDLFQWRMGGCAIAWPQELRRVLAVIADIPRSTFQDILAACADQVP